MQTKWDDLDKSIATSFEDIEVQIDYNAKLIERLHEKQSPKTNRDFVPSLSLIAAGLFIMLLGFTNLQTRWIDLEYSLRNQATVIQFQYNDTLNFIKHLGE